MVLQKIKAAISPAFEPFGGSREGALRSELESALASRSGLDPKVVDAVLKVPREEFVLTKDKPRSHEDRALSIGNGQTISQPSLVAHMISSLRLPIGNERVLDVGCGSGYQAAILSLLAKEVVAVERVPELLTQARSRLAKLGYSNVSVVAAPEDCLGFPSGSPYDAIIVGASVPAIPQSLLEQLKDGGRMVIPVGEKKRQRVATVVKRGTEFEIEFGLDCVFVPLIGPEAWQPETHRGTSEVLQNSNDRRLAR